MFQKKFVCVGGGGGERKGAETRKSALDELNAFAFKLKTLT